MVTFTINIHPMLAYIPYMDPMGKEIQRGQGVFQSRFHGSTWNPWRFVTPKENPEASRRHYLLEEIQQTNPWKRFVNCVALNNKKLFLAP